MRLHIQNINKIKEADIALNGLTVIVGENDMGKSTIGRAFFSTIKAVSNTRSLSNESSAHKASKHIDSLYKHFYGKKIIDDAINLLPRIKSEMERICQDESERNAFLDHLNAKIDEIDLSPPSNPQLIGFSGILVAKRQKSFYCTYFLHNRNVADTKSPYPIKRLEVIRWFNQKSMVFNQSLS